MFKRCVYWGFVLGAILIAKGAMAFPCFVTVVKATCWTDYTVTVDVLDAETDKRLTTIVIPKGESWSRGRFDATEKHHFMLRSKFKPAFWKAEKNKIYYAKSYWALPDKFKQKSKALHVNVCFPENFAGVPLPPKADLDCKCVKQNIPGLFDEKS